VTSHRIGQRCITWSKTTGRQMDDFKENNVPVLSLIQFSKAPFVTFGTFKLGTSKSAVLRIENPDEDVEAEVTVEKIPSSKGFSVDHRSFTIQPEGFFNLTVTWTPTDEGGIRELITFSANGVLKHQAVMLGRAEAPKKKKKSLWDTIKSKKGGERVGVSRGKKPGHPAKITVNKTFQVSREPHYKRDKPRSPQASLSKGEAARERVLVKSSIGNNSEKSEKQKPLNPKVWQQCLPLTDQENVLHFQRNSPVVLLVPATKVLDSGFISASPDVLKPENKNILKVLNKTISPIGTPERFKKLIPYIESESTGPPMAQSAADANCANSDLAQNSAFSLSNALALIDSELSQIETSPGESSFLSEFSDSLESKSDSCVLKEFPNIPESNEPRLTFFINKKVESNKAVYSVKENVVSKSPKTMVKKARFTSTTVTKSKGPVEENSLSERKIKKSRRRLLEKTLELDSSSQHESGPDTPKLPVILSDSGNTECLNTVCDDIHQLSTSNPAPCINGSPTPITFPLTSPPLAASHRFSFSVNSPPSIPRHPMPFAAKNMFFDERWIEKQERGFTWWINYVLTPDDFRVNIEVAKVNAVSLAMGTDDNFSVPKAPTKEEVSFSTYTARRKLTRLRRSACQLFTSETMVKAIQRLELEVESRRLLVRKDRHLWKDIGERKKLLKWLLSYNPLWLRIGLETIFGELISLESNSDVLGLAMFILQRLLWNADIAAEFRHAKVPHLYKEGHEEALSRFTLKKLLLLVCFLDKAKESRLIEHDPCLFCVDAEFKTSKDLLLAFSRDFLSGEGILPRHLGYLGLPVSHAQKPLDEFDFAVKNLAVDLRCGIRLVRVMELLTQDWSLSPKLRLPAISRLQKVHNTDVALQVLKSKGVDLKDEQGTTIDSRDIVDGHREKTLSLLWKIIFAFHVILDENQLREEITFLRRTLRTKQRLESLRADHMPRSSPTNIREPYEHSSTKISLLMDWARAVCDFYSLKVENFTVTFSDGRILCHLIHHYHPGLLPEEAVSHSTTQTMECSLRGRLELSCSASDSDSSFDSIKSFAHVCSPLVLFKELLENERNNFRLVNTAVAYLGGVPAMINPADMSNTIPNEKVVMSYLTFLCARLLDLRNETRAARVIQGAWRKYRLKKDLQERNMAAVKIQLLVRRFLQRRRAVRQNQAALVIQSLWRGHVTRVRLRRQKEARIRTLQHRAATIIQASVFECLMFSTLRSYQHLRYHAIIVQAQWRMKMAACAYGKLYWAAAVLQTRWRALVVARRERERYLSLRATVRKLQSGYRRWKAFKSEKENNAARMIQGVFRKWYGQRMAHRSAAAATIQSWYRMQKCLCQYRKIKKSALLIQALYRGHAQRRRFEAAKLQQRSAVILQRAFRGHAVRKQVARMRSAAVLIQRWFRAIVRRDKERQEFVRLRSAAVTIQAAYRGNVARAFVKKQQKAALAIQAAFRRYAAQSRYISMRKAAVVIQQKYRAYILARKTLKDFVALRYAVVIIQSNWRGRADRKKIKYRHSCATVIKAHYRRHKMQSEYRAKKAAAVIIQRQYRAFAVSKKTREAFMCERKACITLQAAFRGMRTRVELRRKHQAATIIQSTFRKFSCRNQYILLQSASFVIQSRYRALLLCRTQQKEYRQLQQAAVKIQALYRGFRVREELKYRNKAARIIQAQFRMYRIRMIYLATKCAAIIVQERFRAQILRNQQLHKYRTMKSAAVTIQKVFRGHIVRRNVTEMHRAAAVIQRMFLVVRDRRRFLAVKSAASVCQRRYRALSVARKDRLDFLSKRRAATCLQAVYRGYKVRGQLRVQNMAAVTVQAHYRAYKQRSHYRRLRWAATVVQARYRASKAMRQEVYKLSAKRHATVMIQAAYRGMKCRQIMKQKSQAAGVIQRAYRAHCVRRQYLALRSSVLIIQRRYRATVTANEQVQKYQDLRNAVVALQAACRGRQVRKEVARWHQAATLIQSVFRRHREEVKFQAMRLSAVIIQRYYRACVLQRKDRENYLEVKHAAVVLQATFRGQRVRRDIAKMHKAVTLIQANFRRHRFRRQHWAACVLQHRFRAQRKRDVDVKNYQELRKAVISLQAAYRGRQVRKEVARWHQAATLIQSVFRRHREEVKFQAMRLSAVIIQRYYRACVLQRNDRENFLKVRDAAVVLQAAYRGLHVRRNIAKMHKSATVIQANFRRRKEQSHYRRQYWAACVLQKRFRAKKQKDLDSKHYQMTRDAAIVLQAAYRGMKTRRGIKRSHLAASIIQRALMAHCERRHYLTLKTAVLTIQRRYRANVASKKEMQKYRNIQSAAVTLQAACRGWQVRKEVTRWHQAATLIQSVFKRHREEVKFQAMRLSAVIIQRYYRACVLQREDRENFLKIRGAAVVLQAAFRGKHVRRNITKMHKAATLIQANFRRHKQQSQFRRQCWAAYVLQQRFRAQRERDVNVKNYQELRKAVISLQAAVRGFNSRRKFKQRHRCATVIQRAYREHCEHKHYMKLNSCVINIQRRYRATLVAKKQRTQYLEMHSAAVVLQAAYRGHQVRMEVTRWHRAAAVIQSQFRKHKEEVKFCAMRVAAIIIQRHYRSCVAQRKEREVFLRKRQSTIVLQAALRGWRVRREIGRQNRSAVVIQSHWRGAVQRVSFQRKRAAALTLQRRFKEMQWGRAERNNYTRMRKAAITLQIHFRAWRTRRQVGVNLINFIYCFRSCCFFYFHDSFSCLKLTKNTTQSKIFEIYFSAPLYRRRVVVAQSMVRTWLAHRHKAAAVIQQAVRKFLLVKRQKRIREGIVKAQALWRGHRSRRLNDNPMVVKLRHRLREVTDTAREEDKLCNKTSSSLDYLLKCKHMSYILEALKNLETATRLSPECCERLVNSGATNTIFTLIRCCNRSVPCMDMITFSIQILLNLSKYHKTIEAVYCVDKSVETLLDLLQRYREKAGDKVADKGGSIFTKACFLVALLLQDKGRAVVRSHLPKASDRISSIYRLTARKHKMDAERTVIKQKMNASINGSFLVQATPRKSRTAPKFAPDWVLKKDKLKDIVDPLRAIQMVADTLSIVL
uniref:Assembly factor for spindle microtubules n=1 Tax=Cynoglossus semilaevis TaxID=244447 RepID=A0A3P8UPN0_CYNSE